MTAEATSPPRYKRSVKNYLVDSRFQLKYTAMILAVTLLVSAFLGTFLWRTSQGLVTESARVVAESKKVSDVVRMSITNDPIYASDPELARAYAQSSGSVDQEIERQQALLVVDQRNMLGALVGGLGCMVIVIGLLGIYFTHKVAGPVYKMKLLLRQIGEGKLNFKGRLRKGDELQDFFETFADMAERLKGRQQGEVDRLEAAIASAKEGGASEESLAAVRVVLGEMRAALDV
jgi:hypothetical protein